MKYQLFDGVEGDRLLHEGRIDPRAAQLAGVPANPSGFSLVDRIRLLTAALITECLPIAAAGRSAVGTLGSRAIERVQEAALLAIEAITRRLDFGQDNDRG